MANNILIENKNHSKMKFIQRSSEIYRVILKKIHNMYSFKVKYYSEVNFTVKQSSKNFD